MIYWSKCCGRTNEVGERINLTLVMNRYRYKKQWKWDIHLSQQKNMLKVFEFYLLLKIFVKIFK